MRDEILLTIITITKDDVLGLACTLKSAERIRTLPGVAHVVVYSGFVDQSLAGTETVVWQKQQSEGIAAAFNEGVMAASGAWVWFLNGGDEVDPRLQSEVLLALIGQSEADVLIGGVSYAGEGRLCPHPTVSRRWPSFATWIPHPATLSRRRLFERFGGFDERYAIAMDYEWFLRVLSDPSVAADVISVPFTSFAAGGVSQRADCRARLAQERDDAIRVHQWRLVGLWLAMGWGLCKAWVRALVARRLGNVARIGSAS